MTSKTIDGPVKVIGPISVNDPTLPTGNTLVPAAKTDTQKNVLNQAKTNATNVPPIETSYLNGTEATLNLAKKNNANPPVQKSLLNIQKDEMLLQQKEYPQPDIRGPMPKNAHEDSTFSSFIHNDWTYMQYNKDNHEYPSPDQRGPMPQNAHPDANFSSGLHNDWTNVQTKASEYPTPDTRGKAPENAHEFMSYAENLKNEYMHNDTFIQINEIPYTTRGNKPIHNDSEDFAAGNQTARIGWWSDRFEYPDKRYYDFESPGKNNKDGDYAQISDPTTKMPYTTRGNKPIHNDTEDYAKGNDTKKVGWWSDRFSYPDKRYYDFESPGKNNKDGDYAQVVAIHAQKN